MGGTTLKGRSFNDNYLIGEFEISLASQKFKSAPKGTPDIRVTFDININGIFDVYARDGKSQASCNSMPCVAKESGRLTTEELERTKDKFKSWYDDVLDERILILGFIRRIHRLFKEQNQIISEGNYELCILFCRNVSIHRQL